MEATQTTLYESILEDIQRKITSGEFQPGDKMYTVNKLCSRYNVSTITAVRVVKELKEKSIVTTIPRKGTFINGIREVDYEKTITGKKIKRITVVSDQLNFPHEGFTGKIWEGIASEVEKLKLSCRIEYNPDGSDAKSFPFTLNSNDALIFLTTSPSLPALSILMAEKVRSVAIDISIPRAHCVMTDNYLGISELIDYLASLGHQHLILSSGLVMPVNTTNENERTEAFLNITREKGIKGMVVKSHDIGKIFKSVEESKTASAILFTRDDAALRFIRKAKSKGIRIPDDISVVGFDNWADSEEELQQLTTYQVDQVRIGRMTVQTLLNLNKDHKCLPQWIRVPGKLIIRETTSKLKR